MIAVARAAHAINVQQRVLYIMSAVAAALLRKSNRSSELQLKRMQSRMHPLSASSCIYEQVYRYRGHNQDPD
eukprot:3451-Heterococcus_DN1.PRE.7